MRNVPCSIIDGNDGVSRTVRQPHRRNRFLIDWVCKMTIHAAESGLGGTSCYVRHLQSQAEHDRQGPEFWSGNLRCVTLQVTSTWRCRSKSMSLVSRTRLLNYSVATLNLNIPSCRSGQRCAGCMGMDPSYKNVVW